MHPGDYRYESFLMNMGTVMTINAKANGCHMMILNKDEFNNWKNSDNYQMFHDYWIEEDMDLIKFTADDYDEYYFVFSNSNFLTAVSVNVSFTSVTNTIDMEKYKPKCITDTTNTCDLSVKKKRSMVIAFPNGNEDDEYKIHYYLTKSNAIKNNLYILWTVLMIFPLFAYSIFALYICQRTRTVHKEYEISQRDVVYVDTYGSTLPHAINVTPSAPTAPTEVINI